MLHLGDRVQVIPGKEHMPEHRGRTGTVSIVQGTSIGIEFDGIPGVHKWYAPSELTIMAARADRVHRVDRLTVDLASPRAVHHANGWVDAPGHLPIVGTFGYPELGSSIEHVPAETAHDPASLATLRGIPLTILHPDGMVDSGNAQELTHGTLLDYSPTADGLDVWVRVWTKDAVQAGKAGLCQLSLGYDCQVDETPGVDEAGKPYTGVQRDRRYNHLAMVDLARVGPGARLRFDAMQTSKLTHAGRTFTIAALLATAVKGQALDKDPAKRKDAAIETAEIVIDGVTMILPRAVVDQIIAMLSGQAAPAEGEVAPVDAAPVDPNAVDPNAPPRMDALPPKMAAQIAALVAAEVGKAHARLDADTRQRLDVERQAGEILGPTFDYATADTWGIAAAAVAHNDEARKPAVDALAAKARKGDQVAAGRLLGHLDAAVERFQDAFDNGGELGLELDASRRADGAATANADEVDEDSADAARGRMIARQRGDKLGAMRPSERKALAASTAGA